MSVVDRSRSPELSPTITAAPLSGISPAFAEEIAATTRVAYAAGDAVPGLPVADGARETGAAVLADLAAGTRLWVATVDGRCAGSVRAATAPDVWEVRRLAVAPWTRGTGLARALVAALESGAARAGAAVELNAVVERGTPAFYGKTGYRTLYHFGAADKPLSEVRMRRDPALAPRPWTDPLAGDASEVTAGVVVTWWSFGGTTTCRVSHGTVAGAAAHSPAAGARFLGADHWPGATAEDLEAVRETHGGAIAGHDRPAALVPAYALPRSVHKGLLAWWRAPAVRHS
ncbi:GNAT family N-acetyltransferase [Amycolatopsis sp. NPDC049253]|uniref:GNAT family N-acetyltransferase n=1 Tax=Amycolatopsis sp. NPDC049253 TaxID=3155274 RepID=UPI0034472FAD